MLEKLGSPDAMLSVDEVEAELQQRLDAKMEQFRTEVRREFEDARAGHVPADPSIVAVESC